MYPSFWNKRVTVIRAPWVAGRGSDLRPDWDNAVEHVVSGCFFAPIATTEDRDHRDAVSLDYVLRGPANLDVLPTDRVRLYVGEKDPNEPDFEVVGAVRRVPSASGKMDHKRIELKVWTG